MKEERNKIDWEREKEGRKEEAGFTAEHTGKSQNAICLFSSYSSAPSGTILSPGIYTCQIPATAGLLLHRHCFFHCLRLQRGHRLAVSQPSKNVFLHFALRGPWNPYWSFFSGDQIRLPTSCQSLPPGRGGCRPERLVGHRFHEDPRRLFHFVWSWETRRLRSEASPSVSACGFRADGFWFHWIHSPELGDRSVLVTSWLTEWLKSKLKRSEFVKIWWAVIRAIYQRAPESESE